MYQPAHERVEGRRGAREGAGEHLLMFLLLVVVNGMLDIVGKCDVFSVKGSVLAEGMVELVTNKHAPPNRKKIR